MNSNNGWTINTYVSNAAIFGVLSYPISSVILTLVLKAFRMTYSSMRTRIHKDGPLHINQVQIQQIKMMFSLLKKKKGKISPHLKK